jgi:hypothetical protein
MVLAQDLILKLNLTSYFDWGLRYCLRLKFKDTFQV